MRKLTVLLASFITLFVFLITHSKADIAESFCYPTDNTTIVTQLFNGSWSKKDNNGNVIIAYYGHTGIDIAGGSNIKSVSNGKVVEVGYSSGFGNHVRIKHVLPNGDTVYSQYGHLQSNSITVGVDEYVVKEKIIGIMGSTGFSTGVHLHWEIKKDDLDGPGYSYGDNSIIARYYDPIQFIQSNNYIIPYQYDFKYNYNPQGWTTGYSTVIYKDPVDTHTFGVRITGSNPGIVSPSFPPGLMANDVIAHFSMKQKNDNCSFLLGKIWVKDETGSWNNPVPIELANADYEYNNGLFKSQDYNLYRANFSVLRKNLEVRQFSVELSEGCGSNEYWIMDWLKIYQRDPIIIATSYSSGLYPPENLIALAASSSQINLNWNRGLNPSEYTVIQFNVYRNGILVASTNDASYSDIGLSSNTQYCYKVSAYLGNDESVFSSQSCVTTLSSGGGNPPPPVIPPPPPPPVANFTVTPESGNAPLEIITSNSSAGDITSYSWDFGDGALSSGTNATHIFSNPGIYTVTLTVTGSGGTNTTTKTITVNPDPDPAPAPPTNLRIVN